MRFLLFLTLAFCLACSVKNYPPGVQELPRLTVQTDSGTANLRIATLEIEIQVTGNVASTVYDIRFYNPYDRVLEGSFEFPLAEGQTVYRYGLEINGSMREGVVVEKQEARVAYESTVRQEIDPGLVEKTVGNSYRTRVYPIPAKGYKRIRIGVEQALRHQHDALHYQLPLKSNAQIDSFRVNATVYNSAEPETGMNSPRGFSFGRQENQWVAGFHEVGFVPDFSIDFSIPFHTRSGDLRFTGIHNNETYFYLAVPVKPEFREKAATTNLTVLWDVSGSGASRDIKREIGLLETYLEEIKNTNVRLIAFRHIVSPAETFEVKNGDSKALVARIRQFDYDGGTQMGDIDLGDDNSGQVLLFTDGISTFGRRELKPGKAPLTVISSSVTADHSYLKYIATQAHGSFIDLTSTSNEEALQQLVNLPMQFIGADYNGNEIRELCTGLQTRNGFAVSGILESPAAEITLKFGYGTEVVRTLKCTVSKGGEMVSSVPRRWATMKLERLEMQPGIHKEEITRIGKEFSVVTSNTSLLVLDRVEDYVRYAVTPPAPLRKQYDSLMAEQTVDKPDPIARSVEVMNELKEWYHTRYGKEKQPQVESIRFSPPGIVSDTFVVPLIAQGNMAFHYNDVDSSATADQNAEYQIRAAEAPPDTDATLNMEYHVTEGLAAAPPPAVANEELRTDATQREDYNKARIEISEWKADEVYLAAMEKTAPPDYYRAYLRLKESHGTVAVFYVDIAGFLRREGATDLALQVLSNVVELKLEDAELMRILGHQLQEWKEYGLSIEVFSQLLRIRGEHPQSYRDLALANAEAGRYQEAADGLYHILRHAWDERFDRMTPVVLNEFNAVIGMHPDKVNTSAYDKRLVYPMPVDLRVVITWSSDDTDIDLWVTDPAKEKCFYSEPLTTRGGRLSGDITRGFGPEDYCIRKAPGGRYTIEVNYYGDSRQSIAGPVTVKAEVYTHYGRPRQKKEVINLRLGSSAEVVKVGEVRI